MQRYTPFHIFSLDTFEAFSRLPHGIEVQQAGVVAGVTVPPVLAAFPATSLSSQLEALHVFLGPPMKLLALETLYHLLTLGKPKKRKKKKKIRNTPCRVLSMAAPWSLSIPNHLSLLVGIPP